MIRVLIAEDEPPTLRRIKNMIERLDPEFQVVRTAHDGLEALAQMAEEPCDAVFTDIRMPEMDGLQMMDEIHIRYPSCIVVVLSGYREFDYVAHAMRSQAVDYLLKPISEEDMRKILIRIKELNRQKRWERQAQRLSALAGRSAQDQTEQGETIAAQVALFCAGSPLRKETSAYEDAWVNFSLQANADAADGKALYYVLSGNSAAERIVLRLEDGHQAEHWAKSLYGSAASTVAQPICCAYLTAAVGLPCVGDCARKLRARLTEKVCIGENMFLCLMPQELGETEELPGFSDTQMAGKLYELLKDGKFGTVTPFRRELFLRFKEEKWTQLRIYELFMQAVSLFAEETQRRFSQEFVRFRKEIAEVICDANDYRELEEKLVLVMPEKVSPKKQQEDGEGIPYEIRRYLRKNYGQQHLNNQTLSAEFGYVPGYISQLFKQEFGISPIDYLMQYRIEKAKELIRQHPDMLIGEVSERVGFISQHHFSRIFKKYEGMWPSSYRS